MISFSDTTIFSISSFRILALSFGKKDNRTVGVYIINFEEIVYHQSKALYIIIAEVLLYRLRLMIYAFGDDIHTKVLWYTIAFAMDKKRQSEDCLFWSWKRDSNTRPMVVFKDKYFRLNTCWNHSFNNIHIP